MRYPKKELYERDTQIVKLIMGGECNTSIAKKYGITKQRVNQIATKYNLKPVEIKRDIRKSANKTIFEPIINNANSKKEIRDKIGLTKIDIVRLKRNGVDLGLKDDREKRYQRCYELYMEGHHVYEILGILKNESTAFNELSPSLVYKAVKYYAKTDRLPKRVSNKTRYSNRINEEITRLFGEGYCDKEITKILLDNGFKNADGGELRLPVITWRMKKLKLIK